MRGRIEIYLPILKKLGVVYYKAHRKVGFHFDNMAMWLLCENTNTDISKFEEKFSGRQDVFIAEMIFAAYCSWCMVRRKKQKYTKEQILKSFSNTTDSQRESILKTWKRSETFGVNENEKKKAVNQ